MTTTDLMHTVGLMHRELKDARSIMANVQHHVRQLREPQATPRPAGLVARLAACAIISRGTRQALDAVVKQNFPNDRDLAALIELRTATAPAMTGQAGWAAELVGTAVTDVADNLLGDTALAQLRARGLAYGFVPGSGIVRVPTHTPTPSGAFVPEGGPIPLGALIVVSLGLKPRKAAAITTFTRELAQGSPSNVETSLRTLLADDVGLMVDQILLGSAAASTTQPAGLLNGLVSLAPTAGGGLTALMGDVKKLFTAIAPAVRPALLMNATQTAAFALLAPNAALPVIAPYLATDTVVAVDAAAFASAFGVPEFMTDDDAAIHEESAPSPLSAAGAPNIVAAPVRSLWQTSSLGIRTLMDCDWTLRRAGAVAFITGITW